MKKSKIEVNHICPRCKGNQFFFDEQSSYNYYFCEKCDWNSTYINEIETTKEKIEVDSTKFWQELIKQEGFVLAINKKEKGYLNGVPVYINNGTARKRIYN